MDARPLAQQSQPVNEGPPPGSLEARVHARREQLEQKTTELFDVPNYEGIFRAEMRVLGGKRRFKISEAHDRLHDDYQKGVRSAADTILAATVGIHAVVDDDGTTALAEGMTWLRLAQAADKNLGPDTKPRVALIRLLTEEGVIALAEEWLKWTRTRGSQVERELERDL